jgi:hypothetical protein
MGKTALAVTISALISLWCSGYSGRAGFFKSSFIGFLFVFFVARL